MKQSKVSLEQWQAFIAVVDEGSFAKAADALNKSQSTISYAISKLEEQLPAPVLTIEGRRAVLTDEGKVLYRKASQLIDLALNVEQVASCLAEGWETQLTINMESIVPASLVLRAIQQFSNDIPQTRITLVESTLSGSTEALLEKKADIVLTGRPPPGFLGAQITDVEMIPVAHSNHPLSRAKKPLSLQDLQQYRQIVVRDSGTKRNQDAGWLGSEQRLTVSHFSQTLQALLFGLGFSFAPKHIVEDQINAGVLKELQLQENYGRKIPIYLIQSMLETEGPAVKEMSKIIKYVFDSNDA